MSYRAGILLLQDDKIALTKWHREGLHCFTLPGGQVEEGETSTQTTICETLEEPGLQVMRPLCIFY